MASLIRKDIPEFAIEKKRKKETLKKQLTGYKWIMMLIEGIHLLVKCRLFAAMENV